MDVETDDTDPFVLPPLHERRGPGRPRSTGQTYRSEHVMFRVLPSEKVRLTAAAKRAGYPDMSAWCRGVLLAACDGNVLPALDKETLAEVARLRRDLNSGIGANLNQALHHANTRAKEGEPADKNTLLATVHLAQAVLEGLRSDLQRLLKPAGRR